jgi:hypothetical protein
MPITQIMIVHGVEDVDLISSSSCFEDEPLQQVFLQDSSSHADCAHSCGTLHLDGPWSHGRGDSTLRFRCTDLDPPTRFDPSGFTYQSDASMITTLQSASYRDNNFGIGAGEADDWVDWDQTSDDGGDSGDNTQILVYGR